MKNIEITWYLAGLRQLTESKTTDGLTITGSQKLQLIRLFRQLELAFMDYQKTRNMIVKEYAEKDDDGVVVQNEQGIKIQEDKIDEFNNQMIELDNAEVDVVITKSAIRIPEMNNLSPQAIDALSLLADEVDRMFTMTKNDV